jgi:hypothetical protein
MTQTEARDEESAEAWIAYTIRCDPKRGDLLNRANEEAAVQAGENWDLRRLHGLQFSAPNRAVSVIFAVARQTQDHWILTNLGGGPLEELLRLPDGEHLEAVSAEARDSIGLRTALRAMWSDGFSEDRRNAVRRLVEGFD